MPNQSKASSSLIHSPSHLFHPLSSHSLTARARRDLPLHVVRGDLPHVAKGEVARVRAAEDGRDRQGGKRSGCAPRQRILGHLLVAGLIFTLTLLILLIFILALVAV